MQVKADSMSSALKNVFLGELGPHKKEMSAKREQLLKAVDAAKGGGDVDQLLQPERDAEVAVKDFQDFLVNNNMK